jgi:hypothetical protein
MAYDGDRPGHVAAPERVAEASGALERFFDSGSRFRTWEAWTARVLFALRQGDVERAKTHLVDMTREGQPVIVLLSDRTVAEIVLSGLLAHRAGLPSARGDTGASSVGAHRRSRRHARLARRATSILQNFAMTYRHLCRVQARMSRHPLRSRGRTRRSKASYCTNQEAVSMSRAVVLTVERVLSGLHLTTSHLTLDGPLEPQCPRLAHTCRSRNAMAFWQSATRAD